MKKGRLLVLAAASAAFCAAAVACGGHEHEYGTWTITTAPTLTAEGSATRTCTANDGGVETVNVPALSNTEVWSSETTDATHTSAGKIVYTSVYGTVEIPIPQGEHSWGKWTIAKAPSATETGTAERACTTADGGKDTVTLPVLTDTSVWTKDTAKSTPATHTADGKDVYTSSYGTVEVTVPKNADAHTYGGWVITTKPTLTTEGVATRTCTANDGGKETQKLAALSNTLMWKKDAEKSMPATHTAEGKDVYTSTYGTVEIVIPKDETHTYGDWTITKNPTATEEGTAERVCSADQHKDSATLPVLTDTTVWTKDTEKSVANSHTADGKDVYTSEYGEVTVVIPKSTDHAWSAWEITQEPTLTATGTAKHSCTLTGCTEQDVTATVPALNDTAVWKKNTVAPDYNNAGKDVYTSDYGTVELPGAPKLAAPYEGKTYVPVQVEINSEGKIAVTDSWVAAKMSLDANGEGTGTAFPYQNESWKVTMVNAEKGAISIATQSTNSSGEEVNRTYTAYVDMATGVIVRPRDASWSTVFVFLPYEWESGKSKVEAAVLDESIAITYSKDDVSESSFVFNDKTFFGVTFASDKAGEHKISVGEFKENGLVYVIKNNTVIASFAINAEGAFVAADGYEGYYQLTRGDKTYTVVVSGCGLVALFLTESGDPVPGSYTLAEAGAGYTAGAYFDFSETTTEYYEVTLDNEHMTGTITMPMVTVKYNVGEGQTAIEDGKFNKNVAIEKNAEVDHLPEIDDSENAKKFGGWYFDAACTQPVTDKYIPTADVTLYAKWTDKGSIGVVVEKDGAAVTVYFGDGSKLSDVLTANKINLGVDVSNWRVFRGWYLDAGYTQAISAGTTLGTTDSGKTIYAKWEALPAYYGEFAGNALNKDANYSYAATVKLDENDVVTLNYTKRNGTYEIKGTVIGYNEATQLLTWKDNAAEKTYYMWLDKTSGILAFTDDIDNDEIESGSYILSRNGDTITNNVYCFGDYAIGHTNLVTYSTKGGETKTLLIFKKTIYADVTVSDYKGTALAVNEVENSKTLVVKQNGTAMLALGSTGVKIGGSGNDELGKSATLQLLDAYYGTYTVNGKDYFLNGLGQIEWEGKKGAASAGYTFVKEEGGFRIFDVFEREVVTETVQVKNPMWDEEDPESSEYIDETRSTYKPVGYYQLKLAQTGSTFEKIMVTVTVKNATGPSTADGTAQVNAKVVTLPEAPVDPTGASIFVGWYQNEALTEAYEAVAFEVGGTYTLYAKWDTRVTVTVHFNYEDKTEVYEFAQGATADIPELTRDGYYLVGLYTDAALTEEWTGNGEAINENAVVYAKWELAAQMAGTFKGTSASSKTQATSMSMSSGFTCGIDGGYTYKSGTYGTEKKGTLNADQKVITDGSLVLGAGDSYDRYAYFNKAAGMVVWGTSGKASLGTSAWFAFDESRVKSVEYSVHTSIKVNGTAKITAWFTVTYKNDTTMNVLVYNDKIYDNVTWTAGVAASKMNDSKEIQVWDKNGTEILLQVYYNYSYIDPKAERGTYKNTEDETLFLNGGDQITYGDKKGTYSAVSGKEYNFNVDFGSERWWLTVDQEAHTFSIEKPMATVTFDMNGKGEAVTAEQNVSKRLYFSSVITSDPVADGFIFRGWYDNAGCTGSAQTSYMPSDKTPKTFYAKWDKAITVTLDYRGKKPNESVEGKYVGDTYTPVLPTEVVGGQGAEGWYTDAEFTNKVTGSYTFTDDTVFYCKWVNPHALMGTYKGYEFYNEGVLTSVYTVTIDLLGKIGKDTLVAGEKAGEYTYGGKYLYYDAGSKTIIVNYGGTPATWKNSDFYVVTLVESTDTLSASSSVKAENCLMWNNKNNWLGRFKINDINKYFYIEGGKVYGNVSVEVNGTVVTDLSVVKSAVGNELVIKDATGKSIFAKGWNGTDFVEKDTTAGTYVGTLNGTAVSIVSNGYGGFSIDGEVLSVVRDKDNTNKLTFTLNNSMKVITIDTANKTYAQVQDGYAGTYTLPDDAGTIVFDGLGGAGDGKTYVVDGATVTVYESDGSKTAYGIDVENKTLAGKSKFAGYTFTGKYTDRTSPPSDNTIKVTFDDSPSISGVIIVNNNSLFYFNFTAEFDTATNTITFTITKSVDSGAVNKKIKATLSGSTMTFTECGISNNAYTFNNNGSATCEGFSL